MPVVYRVTLCVVALCVVRCALCVVTRKKPLIYVYTSTTKIVQPGARKRQKAGQKATRHTNKKAG